jgi:glycosyltransferase involved in cell wall biosynthesis
MSGAETVTIGVPVYRGEPFVVETLRSIQSQTHQDFQVVISLDGPQPDAEALCRPFLDDSRFRLVTQPERLGWVGNLNWLMARVETPYWCYQQQDDLIDPSYLETLIDQARRTPEGAVFYCDIEGFGLHSPTFAQASITGSAPARQLAILFEHFAAVAFRGLTRVEALRFAGGIPPNPVDSFACDAAWMAAMARWGELRRVPVRLYRKRYHEANEHMKWFVWPLEKRVEAWVAHCAVMLEQAMLVDASAQERRLLWLAAVGRLVSTRSVAFIPIATWTAAECIALLDTFFEYVRERSSADIPALLEASWADICEWTAGYHVLPAT